MVGSGRRLRILRKTRNRPLSLAEGTRHVEAETQVQRKKPRRMEQTQERDRTTCSETEREVAAHERLVQILILDQNPELNSLISEQTLEKAEGDQYGS